MHIALACRRCQENYRGVLARDPAAVGDMAATLVMAGAAISMFGTSRPCAGSEHQLAHVWEVADIRRQRGDSGLHGNFVGLGTIASILLYREAGGWALREKLGVDRDGFYAAFSRAAQQNPRYTILTFLQEKGCLDRLAERVTARIYER